MTIRVNSFDFDGCLFNMRYIYSPDKDVIGQNQTFLDAVKSQIQPGDTAITFIGSNRQSRAIDDANAPFKGSCFPAVERVNDYLGATLDRFLLADVHGNLEDGMSFNRAQDRDYSGQHADWLFDETKVSILYAQMHRMANAYPDEAIVFSFYDDRQDILDGLQQFFTLYPNLIPANVQFRSFSYAGEEVIPQSNIQGTGIIDENYRQTVRDMGRLSCSADADGIMSKIYVRHHVTPDLLTNRVAKTAEHLRVDPSRVDPSRVDPSRVDPSRVDPSRVDPLRELVLRNGSYEAVQFQHYINLFYDKCEELRTKNHFDAAEVASKLYRTLYNNAQAYFDEQTMELDTFKNNCTIAINEARPELETHRGWKHLLGNFALFVVGLGVGYAIAAVANKIFTGNFTFFKQTDSALKLNYLEEAVTQLAVVA